MSAGEDNGPIQALNWRHIDQAKSVLGASSSEQFVELVTYALTEAVSNDTVEDIVEALKAQDVSDFETWADTFHMQSK